MKRLLSPRGLFVLAFVVLAASNIAVLCGVAYNRSGSPDTLIALSERELPLPYRVYEDDSGLALRVVWRVLGPADEDRLYRSWGYPTWFTEEKLTALGFRLGDKGEAESNQTLRKEPLSKEVFIVLEKGGAAYREAVARAERARAYQENLARQNHEDKRLQTAFEEADQRLARERLAESRLFAVDAGLDPAALRGTYADRARFIITKGLVKPAYDYDKHRRRVRGYIVRLSVETIHVPLAHRHLLDALIAQDGSRTSNPAPPRYAVDLAYGRRFEPWIVAVRPIKNTAD